MWPGIDVWCIANTFKCKHETKIKNDNHNICATKIMQKLIYLIKQDNTGWGGVGGCYSQAME